MNRLVAIDSNALTYLIEAKEPGYDPATDKAEIATERLGMLRAFFYGGCSFWISPTVEREYNKIRDPQRHLRHQRTAMFLLRDDPLDADSYLLEIRVRELLTHHGDENDCRILAEAEFKGLDTLLSCDQELLNRLGDHTSVGVRRPSEFWSSLGIRAGSKPLVEPAPSNPLAGVTWWRV